MLPALASKESLGDSVTHFMKSGSSLRSKEIDAYIPFKNKIPNEWHGLPVSYDIWWDTHDSIDKATSRPFLSGFCYTDFLNKCVLFKPANSILAESLYTAIVNNELEPADLDILNLITGSFNDKYVLNQATSDLPERVIFLPGTNIIDRMVDFDRVEKLVFEEGAKIKPHPITSKYHVLMLQNLVGAENVIDKKESGMAYLAGAKVVFCCSNSEMGLSALLMNKQFCLIDSDKTGKFSATYKPIYMSILKNRDVNPTQSLIKLMTSPYSGIVHIDDPMAEQKMYNFFNSFNFFRKVICNLK